MAAGSALAFSTRRAPTYVAKASVFIGPRSVDPQDLGSALEELTFSREFIASYARLLRSRPLAERVVESENLLVAPTELIERIETQVVTDTRIIEVSVSDSDPARAALTVNSLVEVFVTEGVEELGGGAGVRATVFEPALRPTSPVSPKPLRDGILGAVLGLALGIGAAFLLEQMDTTMRSREEVEEALAPLPVLAAIPNTGGKGRKLIFDSDAKSPAAESLRILRTNVHFFSVDTPTKRILITSPYTEDGKTIVAANLAASMAAAGIKTILIEADLRRPAAHNYFGIPLSPGISELLVGEVDFERVGQQTGVRNLAFLPAGSTPPNPSELLGTQKMVELLKEASLRADMVILDSPPSLAVTDATVLAPHVDGVIMVVRSGRTHREKAKETKTLFERMGARVLGVVLNDVDPADAYYYYRYYHGYYTEGPKKRRGKAASQWTFPEMKPAKLPGGDSAGADGARPETEVEPGELQPRAGDQTRPSSELAHILEPDREISGQSPTNPRTRETGDTT